MKKSIGLALLMAFCWTGVRADSPTAQTAKIVDVYQGGFRDDYPQELVRVRSYILPIQSDIATSLGLQYGQGFLHPVVIRFDDGAPAVSENPFFYVQLKGDASSFSQDLVVNVEAFARRRKEGAAMENTLRGGFRYALTQVMLNDATAGGANGSLPLWIQEGLAVYISGDGDNFVRTVGERVRKSHAGELAGELNSPGPYLTARDWSLYYLAIKYIASNGALQAFVRNILHGKSPADSIRESLSQEWPVFTEHVHAFATQEFTAYARPDEEEDEGHRSRH